MEIQESWTSSESQIWQTVFACAKEFGWTAHYILNEVPVYWLKKILVELGEYSKMKSEALNGKHYTRARELTDEQREQFDRKLAMVNGIDYEQVRSDKIFG